MTIKIGRFGNGAAGYTVPTPMRVQPRGSGEWDLSGVVQCSSAAQMKAVRQNVLGLGELDEPVVPVEFSDDTDFDGFYEVTSSSVDTSAEFVSKNRVAWSVGLRRIPDYALPQIEAVLFGSFRSNSHAITPLSLLWFPSSAFNVYASISPSRNSFGTVTRTTDDGSVLGYYPRSGSSSAAERATLQYMIGPSDWYDGACRVEVNYGGTYYPVVGRNPYSLLSSTGWRITNGRLRVAPSATAGRLDVSVYDTSGAAWETTTFKLYTSTGGSDIDAILTFAILRNSPEEVVVRLGLQESITAVVPTKFRHTLDLTLRRGEHHVECYWTTEQGSVLGYVKPNTVTASTTLTGGIRATSNDAAGNRYVIYTPRGKTNDLVNGGLNLTAAATSFPFCIGIEYGGSGSSYPNDAAGLSDEYFGAYSGLFQVLGR